MEPVVTLPVGGLQPNVEAFPCTAAGDRQVNRVLSTKNIEEATSDGMYGTVRFRPAGVGKGPEIEGRVLLDTVSQINVISRGLFDKIQPKYPARTLITTRPFYVVLADQAVAQAVGSTDPLNVTITSGIGIAGPAQLSCIVSTVLEGDDDLLLLGHPTMVSKLGINVEGLLTNLPANSARDDVQYAVASLATARGVPGDSDSSVALLIDRVPYLLPEPDEELHDRVRLLTRGIQKADAAGMGSVARDELSQIVLLDFKGTFRAGLRLHDPPADVPAMKVRLLPGTRPIQARARRASPEKANFIKGSSRLWSLLTWWCLPWDLYMPARPWPSLNRPP